MVAKIWHAESIKTHLRAIKAGVEATVPTPFIEDSDGYTKAYLQGSQAAIDYVAKRFGVELEDDRPPKKPPTGELQLRTWNKQDIKRTLEIGWKLLLSNPVEAGSNNRQMKSYHHGIKNTLLHLADSFDIEKLDPLP